MDAEDGSLRERLVGLKVRRDELAAEIADLQKRLSNGEPTITPDKIVAFAALLRDKLRNGPRDLKQAYVRLVMREVSVGDKKIQISGSKAVLARAASDGLDKAAPAVLSFVRKWRTRQDSHSRNRDLIFNSEFNGDATASHVLSHIRFREGPADHGRSTSLI